MSKLSSWLEEGGEPFGRIESLASCAQRDRHCPQVRAGSGFAGPRRSIFYVSLLGLLLALMWPMPLRAGKNKAAAPTGPVKPGDQRKTGYFDVAKIVWPNPPAIPRVAFQDLYTGEKIDPNLYTKKGHKSTWMDR